MRGFVMKKINLSLCFLMVLGSAISSCTKTPKSPDGRPLVGKGIDPQRVVVTVQLGLPKSLEKKVKPTDLMIWTLKDNSGELIAGKLVPVPEFPFKNEIKAAALKKEIPEGENLFFDARIVKNGEESKPPKRGQLHVSLGESESIEPEVTMPNVDAKQLEAIMKKMNLSLPQKITVGAKVEAELKTMNF